MNTVGGYLEVPGGDRIVVLCNFVDEREARGTVLIVPPFGRSAKDMFFFAFYLWRQGFNVVRFDARHHVGASTGEIADFTLSSLEEDLGYVCRHLQQCGLDMPILLGISLSTPVVLKYVAQVHPAAAVVSIVGAFDVKHAIESATGASVAPYRNRAKDRAEFQTILGYQVRAQPFVDDMDDGGFGSLDLMLDYIRSAPCQVHMIMASDDDWVTPESVMRCHQASASGSVLSTFDSVTHEFGRSVATAKRISLEICRLCCLVVDAECAAENTLPNFSDMLRANSVEATTLDALVDQKLAISSRCRESAFQ